MQTAVPHRLFDRLLLAVMVAALAAPVVYLEVTHPGWQQLQSATVSVAGRFGLPTTAPVKTTTIKVTPAKAKPVVATLPIDESHVVERGWNEVVGRIGRGRPADGGSRDRPGRAVGFAAVMWPLWDPCGARPTRGRLGRSGTDGCGVADWVKVRHPAP